MFNSWVGPFFFAAAQGKWSFSEGLQFYNSDIHGDFFGVAIFRQKNIKKWCETTVSFKDQD